MTDDSTSGPLNEQFLSADEAQTSYEPLASHGFNELVKVKRQGRWFLLKGLKAEFRQMPVYLELLKKEYELMVQLDHPNIVKAISKEVNDELGPCIVMEYIDGVRLDKFLETKPTWQTRRKVVDQLVDALAYIHNKQILHRDLKPSNILVTRNGNNVKIIDFGLSDADDYAILKQSAGNLKYMAPELKANFYEQTGRALNNCNTDVYSFGLLLREIFPHRYGHIAAKCTCENPKRRYADMEAVRKALEHSDRMRRTMPFLLLLLPVFCVFLLVSPPSLKTETPEVMVNGTISEYVEKAAWQINTILHPIAEEVKEGKEYQEVLQAKLAKANATIKVLDEEVAFLYKSNSQERLMFVSEVEDYQKNFETGIMKDINAHCRSYKEDYKKHRISQAEYDSLEWLVAPKLITVPATRITATSATSGIGLLENGYRGEMEMGICWGVLHKPTLRGCHASCNRLGDSIVMDGLLPNTTYFVRAYLTNTAGTTYDNEITFTTLPSDAAVPLDEGTLPGVFSVSEGRQVRFSKGNLQYQASTETWQFAENQYDVIGKDNEKISETYTGWIDLFGWATSGYDHGAVNWQPWSPNKVAKSNALHYAYGAVSYNLDDLTGQADWGYNAISNGGNKENIGWHTPSCDDLVYLLFVRKTMSDIRFAKATVNGVQGAIVLPDNWKVDTYQLNIPNNPESDFNGNRISLSDWQQVLEPAGAVFLPCAGVRTIDGVYTGAAYYHSSTIVADRTFCLICSSSILGVEAGSHRGDGMAVRLVQEVE